MKRILLCFILIAAFFCSESSPIFDVLSSARTNAYGKESGLYVDLPLLGSVGLGVDSKRYVETPVRTGYPRPYPAVYPGLYPSNAYPASYPPNAYPHGYPPAYPAAPAGYQYPPPSARPQPYGGVGGYSVLDHSLKSNSEYKEVGHHEGPFQGNQGQGYGSGYGGGYNGAFNRPVF